MSSRPVSSRLSVVAAVLLAGCTAPVSDEPDVVGTLELPLTSIGSNGTRFALAGTFELVGPETLTRVVSTTDANFTTDDVITMSPRVGTYELTLSQWQLARVVTAGEVTDTEPVAGAVLLSAAMQAVEIRSEQTTTVIYEFSVPGDGVIMFARGMLDIDFTVAEGFAPGAACTQAVECSSHVCLPVGVCGAPSCSDGVLNGAETSPDCGGPCSCTDGTLGAPCDGSPGSCTGTLQCLGGICCLDGNCQAPPGGSASMCVKINEVAPALLGLLGFVELYNTCTNDVPLGGMTLDSIQGPVPLPAGSMISSGGYFVVNGDFVTGPGPEKIGSIALLDVTGATIDAVGWGAAGEGSPLPPRPDGGGPFGRVPDGRDTNDNQSDFLNLSMVTPGASNVP